MDSLLPWHRSLSVKVELQHLPLTLRFCYITVGPHHTIDLVHVIDASPLARHMVVLFIHLINIGTMLCWALETNHVVETETSFNDVFWQYLGSVRGSSGRTANAFLWCRNCSQPHGDPGNHVVNSPWNKALSALDKIVITQDEVRRIVAIVYEEFGIM